MRESIVQKEIFMLGISPRHKGFHYLTAVLAVTSDGTQTVDEACKAIEEGDESRQAERCMRYAIRYAWDVNNGRIHNLFPQSKFPPTPKEFIYAVLWKMEDELAEKVLAEYGTKGWRR